MEEFSTVQWKGHARKILQPDPAPASWAQMILCGLSTGVPLVAGLVFNELRIAIFGALTGYFLTISEHVGAWRHRISITTGTFLMLIAGFGLGLALQPYGAQFLVALSLLTYWIALMGGEGAQLEKAFLFSTISMIISFYTTHLNFSSAPGLFVYAFLGYAFVLIATLTHGYVSRRPLIEVGGFLKTLKEPLKSRAERHLHAISYLAIVLVGVWLIEKFKIERGHWALITILLVMKPDRTESLYRSCQRLIGTCLGVVASDFLMLSFDSPLSLIVLITLSASFVPWALKKNYWLVAFFISIIVLLLLDLAASLDRPDLHLPLLRLWATVWGSVLASIGVVISKVLTKLWRSQMAIQFRG